MSNNLDILIEEQKAIVKEKHDDYKKSTQTLRELIKIKEDTEVESNE